MKQLHLDALRDIALEHIPKAQAALIQAKGRSKDYLCQSLYGTTVSVLATASTPATEQAAANLLQQVMQLSINWDDKLTADTRKRTEGYIVNAANELCTLTGQSIPWLPAAILEESEPETPPAPAIPQTIKPQMKLPQPGTNLTTAEAALLLNVKVGTMLTWSSKETGPIRPIKTGRSLAWPSDDVIRAMKGWQLP